MTKQEFEQYTAWKATYEEHQACDCTKCNDNVG